jgi:hypothetical protein
MVADNPEQKIALKMFHSAIQNDHDAMAKEEAAFKPIPIIDHVSDVIVTENYSQIKDDISELFKNELAALYKETGELQETAKAVNIPKPGERPLSKNQRRQQNKHDRQRERKAMRKAKRDTDDKTATGRNYKSISPVKNDDMEQAMSM